MKLCGLWFNSSPKHGIINFGHKMVGKRVNTVKMAVTNIPNYSKQRWTSLNCYKNVVLDKKDHTSYD